MGSDTHTCTTLIIGGGLAGSLLARLLHDRGVHVMVVDTPGSTAAWRAASGAVSPVTGRRLSRPAMLDTLLSCARTLYTHLEAQSGRALFTPMPVVRVFRSTAERQLWEERRSEPTHAPFMLAPQDDAPCGVPAPFGTGVLTGGGRVHTDALLAVLNDGIPRVETAAPLQPGDVDIGRGSIRLRIGITAETAVFCEGWRAAHNPLFSGIPMQPSHGETLVIRAAHLPDDRIISGQVHLVPLGDALYKVGATNRWTFFEETTTERGLAELRHNLDALLAVPYEVVHHYAGLRPAIADRRPVAGLHPAYPHIGILNGLGSKGFLYGPWAASMLADLLTHGTALPSELSIDRFLR